MALSLLSSPLPPTTWRWGWDQSKEKPERVPDLFPKDSFLPKPWGFFSSTKGAVLLYKAEALGNQGPCKSQWRSWDHFARLLPYPQDLLAQSLEENCVIFNQRLHLKKPE